MTVRYTEVRSLNEKMQLMMEQLVLANRSRFGRSSKKMDGNSFLMPYPADTGLFLQK